MRTLFLYLLLASSAVHAQDSAKKRSALLPDHVKLQFAGSTGFLTAAVGYTNKKHSLEGDFQYGYLPESIGGVTIHTASSKLTWLPFQKIGGRKLQVRPLSAGVLVAYTFGKQYFLFSPKNYDYTYYDFPTALHFGLFIGGQVFLPSGNSRTRGIGFYYEAGTHDKAMMNYFSNTRALSVGDVMHLAIGVKKSF
jgi:hypothetical protein